MIKFLGKEEISEYTETLLDLYCKGYKVNRSYYLEALKNSSFVCLQLENSKAVGALRVLSDQVKHAHIVDFMVDEKYRGHGIGGKILSFAVKELDKLEIKYIGLTCSPDLADFYAKSSFFGNDNMKYMRYENK